jgi:MFS family permease
MGAMENLGISTALPLAEHELGHLALYGWTVAAFSLASLIGGVVFGILGDRKSPALAMAGGIVFFGGGLILAAAAPSMLVLVLARFIQGAGVGGTTVIAYLAVGRYAPVELQPKMVALFATAWALPSFIVPFLAGAIAERYSWRWVFGGIVPFVVVFGVIAIMSLQQSERAYANAGRSRHDDSVLSEVSWAIGLTAAAFVVIEGLLLPGIARVAMALGGLVLFAWTAYGLLRRAPVVGRREFATLMTIRAMMGFFFFGLEPIVPFALYRTKGFTVVIAGLILTSSTVSWVASSWFATHRLQGWSTRRSMVVGYSITLVMMAIVIWNFLVPTSSGVATEVAWFVMGAGMGIAYQASSVAGLRLAIPGREGSVSSSLQNFVNVGTGIGAGAIGAIVGSSVVAHQLSPHALSVRFGVGVLICAVVALGTILCAITLRKSAVLGS